MTLLRLMIERIFLGPGVGGDYGPYRQSERNSLYKQYAEKLLQSGQVYRCFCSDEVFSTTSQICYGLKPLLSSIHFLCIYLF